MARKIQLALRIRRQIDRLERRFARTVTNVPKYMLTRNIYGFSATQMRRIARKLHAKAKAAIETGRSKEFRGSIEKAL